MGLGHGVAHLSTRRIDNADHAIPDEIGFNGFGLIGDLLVGIVGAFIGAALLPRLSIHLGVGLIAAIVNATIGAVILLLIARLFRGGPRWSARW